MARKEGRKLVGGVPFLSYDKNGFCPFHSMDQLYRHLYARSDDSEFHREVFVTLPYVLSAAEANDPLAMKALRTIDKNRLLGR